MKCHNTKKKWKTCVSTEGRRERPLLWIVHNGKCPAENPCWLNDIMTLAQLQSSCLYFRLSDSGGQRRKERRHPISLSLLSQRGFSLLQLPFWLSGPLSSLPLQFMLSSMSPGSHDSLKIQPLTSNNLSSRVSMETYVIRTSVASWQVIFIWPATASASLVFWNGG